MYTSCLPYSENWALETQRRGLILSLKRIYHN